MNWRTSNLNIYGIFEVIEFKCYISLQKYFLDFEFSITFLKYAILIIPQVFQIQFEKDGVYWIFPKIERCEWWLIDLTLQDSSLSGLISLNLGDLGVADGRWAIIKD